MDTTMRFVLGTFLLLGTQVLVGGTLVHLLRQRNQVEPTRSWLRVIGAFCILGLVVTGISLVPAVGLYAAVVVSLIGLKRMSGMELPSTFILSFCLGLFTYAVAAALSHHLQVDLLGSRELSGAG